MSDARSLKPLSAFEWASACQYIVYVSSVAGLEEINSSHVVSFPLCRMGAEKLVGQKERVLRSLVENRRSIECFADVNRGELGSGEMSILRSMYVQFRDWILIVEEHLRVANLYLEEPEPDLFEASEVEASDEPLF